MIVSDKRVPKPKKPLDASDLEPKRRSSRVKDAVVVKETDKQDEYEEEEEDKEKEVCLFLYFVTCLVA